MVLKEGLDIRYSCFTSVNFAKIDLLPKLKASGLCGLFIGIETLDEDLLVNVVTKKGQKKQRVKEVIQAVLENGIFLTTSWIYPMPRMTEEARVEMKDLILETYEGRPNSGSVVIVPGTVVPGTKWFSESETFGFEIPSKPQLIKDYVHLTLRTHVPRQLLNRMSFSYEGKTFNENNYLTDRLTSEIRNKGVLVNMTDDWMLMGKLSGRSLEEFQGDILKALLYGDFSPISEVIRAINSNSRQRVFADQKDLNWGQPPSRKAS